MLAAGRDQRLKIAVGGVDSVAGFLQRGFVGGDVRRSGNDGKQ